MTGVPVSPVSPLIPYFPKADGTPASGYRLFCYAAGTTTKLATYTDSTGMTEQTNPIVLNALGNPENSGGASIDIWLQSGVLYKLVYAPPGTDDPPTATVWTIDNVSASGGGGGGSSGANVIGPTPGIPTLVAQQGILYEQSDGGPGSSLWQSLGTSTGNLQAVMLSDGAAHLYPLNETSGTAAVDAVSVSPSNGVYSGSFTLGQTPLSADQNAAALFNGGHVALSYMDLPTVASFSVECLVSPSSETAGDLVANDSPASSNTGFSIKTNGTSGFIANFGCVNGPIQLASNAYAPFSGKTFHVVLTFDSINHVASLYVNAVLVSQITNTGDYVIGAADIWFAKNPVTATAALDGELQLVGLYPTALSFTQVVNHYKAIGPNGAALWFLIGGSTSASSGGGGSSGSTYPIGLLNPPVLTDYTQNILNTWTGTVTQNSSSITIEQTSTGDNTQTVVYLSNDSVVWPLATTLNVVMACTMPSGYNSGQPAAGIAVSLNSPTDLTTFFYGTVQSNTETGGLWWLCFSGSGETQAEETINPLSVYWIRARFDSGGTAIYVDVSTDGTDNSWSKLVSGVMPSGFAPGTPVYVGWVAKGGGLAGGTTSTCSIYSLSTSVTL